jgi:hypothetical protein
MPAVAPTAPKGVPKLADPEADKGDCEGLCCPVLAIVDWMDAAEA